MESCIQSALDDLRSIRRKFPGYIFFMNEYEEAELSLMKTYYAFGRKWGDGVRSESTFGTLEETVYEYSLGVHIFTLTLTDANADQVDSHGEPNSLLGLVDIYLWEIRSSCLREMKELQQSLKDGSLQSKSSSCPIEMGELLCVLDSLIHSLGYLLSETGGSTKALVKHLEFLKNLIRLAISCRGLENRQTMVDMSTHVQRLVIDVVCLYLKSFTQPAKDEVEQVIERIKPVEYHVYRIYVQILEEASKSQSSKLANNNPGSESFWLDMIDSLTILLSEALTRGTRYTDMFDHQICTLYEGLTFLRTTLKGHPDRFAELYDEKMHNIIGVLLCEAGLIVCYLFVKIHDNRLVKPLQNFFFQVERKMKLIRETEEEATRYPLNPASCFPQTNLLGFIDSVLVKMESLLYEAASVVASEKNQFVTICKDLAFLRSWVVNFMGQHDQNEKVQALWSSIVAVAYETEFVIDSLMVGGAIQSFVRTLNTIVEKINIIKTETSEVSPSLAQITKVHNKTQKNTTTASKMPELNEAVVGLGDEAQKMIDRLTRGTKQLNIVSIVGMPGLGKTTLAKKVYRDPSIINYFHVRSWCTISQVHDKKSSLLEILSGLNDGFADNESDKSEDDLANAIRKHLKGKSYLIILDDIWDIEVWNSLKMSFPNDIKGSRILVTSRNENVTSQMKPQSQSPHSLRSLSKKESWELFQKKIRFGKGCPPELLARGKAIAQRCKGLPLMIVIVVGFLLSNMETSRWDEVEGSLMKSNSSTLEQCKETLELSYRHLPEHLKPCFLYFGAYKEDQRIRVGKLLRLWIAEGFVERAAAGCGEDVAESYLTELIERNLVMIAGRGSTGKVKSCMLHDLLHQFCMEKSIGDHFLNRLHGSKLGSFTEPNMSYRLLISYKREEDFAEPMQVFHYLRTLYIVIDCHEFDKRRLYHILYKFCRSKLVRVLELRSICHFSYFPSVILQLGHLRYLTLRIGAGPTCPEFIVPRLIVNLSSLEALTLYAPFGMSRVLLPNTFWKMKNLRGLNSESSRWVLPADDDPEDLSNLENLQSFSNVELSSCQATKEVLRRFPNIRRLKCKLELRKGVSEIVALDFSSQLDSLSISACIFQRIRDDHYKFPQNLKKLTLESLGLPWNKISMMDRLPNLEVLKLLEESFIGDHWEMEEGTFPNLRFLELSDLDDLARWTGSDDQFPCLKKLVLERCFKLKELPSCFAEIPTLQMIKVINCKKIATDSIQTIEERQKDFGNVDLEIRIRQDSNRFL
ncbi:OLC1v1000586C2 [Oldenlandia corymbosa var. corymbosa]|uniref:OLC1v1000586C2 n=1 Tax=Oldenlandia corymbosa var. corymbosa TaxID=529605 RepID=A0AAV1D455_OLDCO|nr:OLC1v1000586C2 [Oldenlandia corymbosa var. corymbosa]